jgi:peptidylprolyl isomerase
MMPTLKKASLYTLAALTLVGCGNSQPENKLTSTEHTPAAHTQNSDVDINKISQALGNFIGRNLNSPGVHFDLESIIKGIRDGAAGKPSPLNDQEYEQAMTLLQQQAINTVSSKNLDEANAYMKENAHAKGVVEVIPGKLQYQILEEGSGPVVEEHGNPQITYTGKYIDGTIFGSSDTAGGPITVPLDQTIPGFAKGLVGMKEGEKRRLFVHPEVGYGTNGQLLPNSLLIFDVEVIKAKSDEHQTADAFHGSAEDAQFDDAEQEVSEEGMPE